MAKRGRTIPLGEHGQWWLRLARGVIEKDPRSLRALGVDLARHVPDKSKFDHGHLSKFASGAMDPRTGEPYDPTLELVDALCEEFRLPHPLAFARSYNEAVAIMATAERYDGVPVESSPVADLTPLPRADEKRRKKQTHAAPVAPTKRRARSA